MFKSLVGERLGGSSVEASASSSLAPTLDYSSAAVFSSGPSPPDAEASRVCRALLDVRPSTEAPAAATTHAIKVDKLSRSATTGITAILSVDGRVVGRASGQAASKEAQTTALNQLQDDAHGKRFTRNLALESNRVGGYAQDVGERGNELWSLIFVRAARRSGTNLSLGQNFMAYVNKNYGVPIRLNVVHRWISDRPNSLRPFFDRVGLDAPAPHDANFARSAGRERKVISPERIRVSVPPSLRKKLGMRDVSVSLAATPRNGYQVPEPARLFWHPKCRDSKHDDDHSSNFVINHHPMREKVPGLSAYKLLAHAVYVFLVKSAAGEELDLQAFIDERACNPLNPAKLPFFGWRRGAAIIKVASEAGFPDFEAFLSARDALMDVIWRRQQQHGRDWLVEHWAEIDDKWYRHHRQVRDPRRPRMGLELQLHLLRQRYRCSRHASICRGTTSYGAQGHFHPADHAFTPHQLHGGLCVFHCISRHFSEVRPKYERGYTKLLNYVQYDAKRGHSLKASDVGGLATTAGTILVESGEIDLSAMRSLASPGAALRRRRSSPRRLVGHAAQRDYRSDQGDRQ